MKNAKEKILGLDIVGFIDQIRSLPPFAPTFARNWNPDISIKPRLSKLSKFDFKDGKRMVKFFGLSRNLPNLELSKLWYFFTSFHYHLKYSLITH